MARAEGEYSIESGGKVDIELTGAGVAKRGELVEMVGGATVF